MFDAIKSIMLFYTGSIPKRDQIEFTQNILMKKDDICIRINKYMTVPYVSMNFWLVFVKRAA